MFAGCLPIIKQDKMIYKLFHIQTLPWRRNKQVRDAFIHVSTEATIAPIEPIQI